SLSPHDIAEHKARVSVHASLQNVALILSAPLLSQLVLWCFSEMNTTTKCQAYSTDAFPWKEMIIFYLIGY
ncbi:hypothetical protein BgiBS90_004184, partial [Biomphalaria glabrata]